MKRAILPLYLIVTCFLITACDSNRTSIEEVEFNIDFDLMQLPVRDKELNVGYALPKGFQELDVSALPAQPPSDDPNQLQIELKKMFRADSNSMVISFSRLKNTEEQVDNILSYPDSLLNPRNFFQTVKVANFRFNNFEEVHQIIQTNADLVNFRMIFKDNEDAFMQIDCITASQDYPKNIKLFESFFGSLSRVESN